MGTIDEEKISLPKDYERILHNRARTVFARSKLREEEIFDEGLRSCRSWY